MNGVTVEFFCAAIKSLVKRHGERYLPTNDGRLEQLRLHLAQAEELYSSFEPVPKAKRQRKKTDGGVS